MDAYTIDGNNLLEVYSTVRYLKKEIEKNPKPVILECLTFRRRGHEEASGTKYVPKELIDAWQKKDPVDNYEKFLIQEDVLLEELSNNIKEEIKGSIEKSWKISLIIDRANNRNEV